MSIQKSDFLNRIMQYCAEAEKSTHDVVTKLEAWGVPPDELQSILDKLRAEKFVDDIRYAKSYVSEKWNLDRWGKIKIQNTLKEKNIDELIITEALAEIEEDEYVQELQQLLVKKLKDVKSENSLDDAKRVIMFALSRGFEEELIQDWIDSQGLDDI